MKNYLTLLFILVSVYLHAQQWQTITNTNLGATNRITKISLNSRPFSINPFNNDIWMGAMGNMHRIGDDGTVEFYNVFSHPNVIASPTEYVKHFGFNSSKTYFVTNITGLSVYNNGTVSNIINSSSAYDLFVEDDTLFLLVSSGNITRLENDVIAGYLPLSNRRLLKRNETIWAANSTIGTYYYTNNLQGVNADTANFLLSNFNYDMKFKHNSDSLYVASELGFSIAYDTVFVDTLTPFNTNMPHPKVKEFEFDKNDNMWAVFSDDNDEAFAVGFYDGSTWSKYYDSTNSPIDWSNFTGIEIDTFNNVWISDEYALHTLKEYQTLDWLALPEYNQEKIEVAIYPNPSSDGVFEIKTKSQFERIEVYSLDGKLVQTNIKQSELRLDKGIFIIHLIDENGVVLTVEKVISL